MITSTKNPKIQFVRKLLAQAKARREAGAFVAEGVRLVEEAQDARWETRLVLYTAGLTGRGLETVRRFQALGVPVEEVAEHVMQAASDTRTPQGILAVLSMQAAPPREPLDLVFIPDAVRDPGNLGAMLRTAAAAGAGAVYLPPGTADPFSPKVVRAGMGAHFRLPVYSLTWDEIGANVRDAGLRVYLAAAGAGELYTEADFRIPLALAIGGEAEGAGPQALALADARVRIPMPGEMESLNAAAAAAVLLFEVVRQRQAKR